MNARKNSFLGISYRDCSTSSRHNGCSFVAGAVVVHVSIDDFKNVIGQLVHVNKWLDFESNQRLLILEGAHVTMDFDVCVLLVNNSSILIWSLFLLQKLGHETICVIIQC